MRKMPGPWMDMEHQRARHWLDNTGVYYKYAPGQEPGGPTAPATGGAPLMPAPGGNVAEPPLPGIGGLEQQPQPGGGFEGTGVGEIPGFEWGKAPIPSFGGTPAPANAGGTAGATAPGGAEKNKSGEGGAGGAQPAAGGQGGKGTGGSMSTGMGPGGTTQPLYGTGINDLFRQYMAQLLGQSGSTSVNVPTPPDLFSNAQVAIQRELARQQQGQAEEAAATGAAGSRDLGYRQSVLGSQAAEAMGRVAPTWQAQQFQLASRQAELQAQKQIAEYNQALKVMQLMNSMAPK